MSDGTQYNYSLGDSAETTKVSCSHVLSGDRASCSGLFGFSGDRWQPEDCWGFGLGFAGSRFPGDAYESELVGVSMSEVGVWSFKVVGDLQVFHALQGRQRPSYFDIRGGTNQWHDCPDDEFVLTSVYWENERSADIVWQIGHELVSLYNGASVLFDRECVKVTLVQLENDGVYVPRQPPAATAALMGPPPMPKELLEAEDAALYSGPPEVRLLRLATENKDVYHILKYLDMAPGWVAYYKLLESIEEFADGAELDLKVQTQDRRRFTNTANNYSLSGFDSRHGFKEALKLNRTPSMTLEEGHDFVAGLALQYLKLKYPNLLP